MLAFFTRGCSFLGMKSLPAIGTRIEALRPADSFYKRVRGVVTGHRRNRIELRVNEVVDQWGTQWTQHPSSCAVCVSLSDVVA